MFWKPVLLWKMYLRIRHININKNMYRSKKRCTESENNVQRQSSRGLLKKGVLTNLVKFTGKHLYQNLFLIKSLAQVFSYEFCKIPKITFSRNTSSGCFWTLTWRQQHTYTPWSHSWKIKTTVVRVRLSQTQFEQEKSPRIK